MKKKNTLTGLFVFVLLLTLSDCRPEQPTSPTSVPTHEPATSTPPSTELTPIIYDDDGSLDGTTALLYILSHSQANLKAVTISYGEAHPRIYIQHIGRVLDYLGFRDIPLGFGQDSPLSGNNEFPEEVRLLSNSFWGLRVPNQSSTYPVKSAPELMVSIINQSPAPVTIFVSGPSTNLAQALELDPGIKENIASIYMMGGAVYVPGNIQDFYTDNENSVAEWNIFADTQAANEMFESGINIYLIPLDATNQILVSRQDTTQWRQGGEAANFAADIYDSVFNNWGVEEAAIWDLLTAVIMLEPDLCVFQPLYLQVVTQVGTTSGQTKVVSGKEANIYVCLEPNVLVIRQTLNEVFSQSR
jgi:pyrimidine-specific ribonucleoside hydrolase